MHFCCFKPHRLWLFIREALGNWYTAYLLQTSCTADVFVLCSSVCIQGTWAAVHLLKLNWPASGSFKFGPSFTITYGKGRNHKVREKQVNGKRSTERKVRESARLKKERKRAYRHLIEFIMNNLKFKEKHTSSQKWNYPVKEIHCFVTTLSWI